MSFYLRYAVFKVLNGRLLPSAGLFRPSRPGTITESGSSEKVEIDDPELIPDEYMRIPDIKLEASKKDIKEALKKGLEVPGAHLESCSNIQIN